MHVRPHARELIDANNAVAGELSRVADDRLAALLDRTLAEAAKRAEWMPRAPYARSDIVAVLLRAGHGTGYGAARLSAAAFRASLRLAAGLLLSGGGTAAAPRTERALPVGKRR